MPTRNKREGLFPELKGRGKGMRISHSPFRYEFEKKRVGRDEKKTRENSQGKSTGNRKDG